jgi:acetylornithine/succinyldiaminopimelate/putrescine aminotransferase
MVGSENFLKALREKCDQHCALLVFDEIQSGFGRTGELFAFEKYKVEPDVLLIAKGMGGGMPTGAFVASRELMSSFTNNPVLGHINTFGGNAVCVAAAQAALEVIVEEKLSQRAAQIEKIIRDKLKHPLIKELRICGALGAIDFCNEQVNMKVIRACIENGVISDWFLFCSTAMRAAPPLNIPEKELALACERILQVLDRF